MELLHLVLTPGALGESETEVRFLGLVELLDLNKVGDGLGCGWGWVASATMGNFIYKMGLQLSSGDKEKKALTLGRTDDNWQIDHFHLSRRRPCCLHMVAIGFGSL